jgi:hypothetical protein
MIVRVRTAFVRSTFVRFAPVRFTPRRFAPRRLDKPYLDGLTPNRDVEAGGSNPLTPTNNPLLLRWFLISPLSPQASFGQLLVTDTARNQCSRQEKLSHKKAENFHGVSLFRFKVCSLVVTDKNLSTTLVSHNA